MVRFALFLVSLIFPAIVGAQTRAAAPAEIRLSMPSAAVSAPSILTPTPLTSPALVPSAYAAPSAYAPAAYTLAPALAAAPITAAPAAAAKAPAAAAPAGELPALPAAAAPIPAPAATPAAQALQGAPAAASSVVPRRGESPSEAALQATLKNAAVAFDGGRPLKVLIAGAEAVPFIKTGGLADVVDALARGLAARGHEVMMVLPKYRQLKLDGIDLKPAGTASVMIGARRETAKLLTAKVNGVNVVLLDHPEYYDRPGGPYEGNGSSYSQDGNDERFAFFSGAALEAARTLGFKPDVAHAHDWHAALIPAFISMTYSADPFFATTRSVMTIHNIAYQGIYTIGTARKLGFDLKATAPMAPLEFWGYTNFLKAGIALADAVTTVSPTYADEIRRGPEFGVGLEGALNARPDGVHGILNGLDADLWDPATDKVLARNYGPDDVAEGKAENKAWLQKRLGLDEKPGAPLFAIASRLAHQKGIDLVLEAIDEIVARGGQVVVTGSGDKPLEKMVADAVARHPGAVASHPFDESFVRAVYAAADFLFMPSRFEPCGLSQLIAHRYGTLPIVTRTGGLSDTVRDLREDAVRGDGIFIRDFTVLALVEATEAAMAGYSRPEVLAAARATAMSNDASWGPALKAYEALYRRLTGTEAASRSASDAPASGDKASSTSSANDARRDGSTAE